MKLIVMPFNTVNCVYVRDFKDLQRVPLGIEETSSVQISGVTSTGEGVKVILGKFSHLVRELDGIKREREGFPKL